MFIPSWCREIIVQYTVSQNKIYIWCIYIKEWLSSFYKICVNLKKHSLRIYFLKILSPKWKSWCSRQSFKQTVEVPKTVCLIEISYRIFSLNFTTDHRLLTYILISVYFHKKRQKGLNQDGLVANLCRLSWRFIWQGKFHQLVTKTNWTWVHLAETMFIGWNQWFI